MTDITEQASYDATVYQIATTDAVLGGPGGIANKAAQALANRTKYLKGVYDTLIATTLPLYAKLVSPTFTGTPKAPTAPLDTNTTQLATTEFVLNQASDGNPLVNGAVKPGTSERYSRADHVHPIDTTRAPLADAALTGAPTSTTPPLGDTSKRITTMEALAAALVAFGTPTSDQFDSTIGRFLKVGDFGIGRTDLTDLGLDLNTLTATGFYLAGATATNKPAGVGTAFMIVMSNAQNWTEQLLFPQATTRGFRRYQNGLGVWSDWVEDWNGGNLVKTASANDTTAGSITKVGDFGLGVTPTVGGNALADGTDLNSVVVSGMYAQSQNVKATAALNYPVTKAGTLLVQRGGTQIVTQTYQEYDTGRQWSRGIYNGTPSSWAMSWDTGTLEKTTSTTDTVVGRMMKVGDYGIGLDGGVKTVINSDAEWSKPSGWTGFIDVAASKLKGATVPTAAGFTSSYGMWQIVGRRDTLGGYTGLFVDYGSGRTWIGYANANNIAPTFLEVFNKANVSAFMQTLLDDSSQAEAQATLGISAMINGITYKNVAGGANVAMTTTECNVGIIVLSGAITANISVSVPAAQGMWNVLNRTTGNFTVTFKTAASGSVGQVVPQGKQSQLFSDGTQIYFGQTAFADAYFKGEVVGDNMNNFRIIGGNYGSFWRNDGGTLYLMMTNSGDQYGNYNALRPFSVNVSTGRVNISNGLGITTLPDGTNSGDAASTAFVQNALAVYGLSAKSNTVTDLNALRGTQFFGFAATATGAVPGSNYDAVGYQIEASGQRTQWAVLAGGLVYVRTDDSTDASGFADWVPQATQDYVGQTLAASGVGTVTGPVSLDLNTATSGGFYRTTSATANSPISSNLSVMVAPYNDGGCLQIASQLGGANRLFWRSQAGGNWTGWAELSSAGKKFAKFTSTGTWTCPEGVTTIWVSGCAGGGGGGGGAGLAQPGAGGGGGGGAGQFVIMEPITVVPGTVYTITIGGGGAAGATAASGTAGKNGSTGGVTRFGGLLTLTGGQLGAGGDINSGAGGFGSTNGGGGSDGGDARGQLSGGDGGSGGSGPYGTAGGGGRAGSGGGAVGRTGLGYGCGGGGGGGGYGTAGTATGGAASAGLPGFLYLEY